MLNASFDLAGPNLNLLNFTAGTNLDVSHSTLTNSYEFSLSSGTWLDSLGADTGSNLLVVLDSVLTGTLSVDSALATDISLSSNLGTLDQVLLSTQGAVSDAPGTQLQTNGALSITAGTVLIGEQLTDSYQLGELNLDTQGLTQVHAMGNLVVAGVDSTNDVRLFADSLEIQRVAIDGSLSAQSRTGNILVGSLVTDGDIFLTAHGGSILDAQDDVLIDLDAGGVINLTADQHILAFGVDQFLEVADGSRVTARSLVGGNIQLQSLGSLELTHLNTADGNMTIRADGILSAIDVDSSTTDSAANFINLTATGPSGNLEIHRVVAGTQNARISLIASGSVLDGDNVADDLDLSAKTVSIHAQTGSVGQQIGVNGTIFQETYEASAGVEILWTDSLTINAGTSAILNPNFGTGVATLNSLNTVVISNSDLDVSNINLSGSTNVALIADADQSGSGNLTLPGNVSVVGDLRIQGADVNSALPLSFNASRFMLISGQAESFTINSVIPNSSVDLDSRVSGDLIVFSQSDLRLIDLNGDNISVSSSTGSIVVVTDTGAIEQLSSVASTQNLLLRAAEDLICSASLVASGNLSLIAGDDVQLKSLVQTTAGGTVFIEAGNSKVDGPDGISMSAFAKILTAHSNAHLAAGNEGNISVQSIDVGKGSLSLVAEGSILGATASHVLSANALRLEADAVVNSNRNGLGSIGLANPTNGLPNANSLAIHTQVSRLSAISAEGIYLVNTGPVVVGTVDSVVVQRVNRDGTLSQNVDRSLSDLTTTNGPIKLQAIDGGIRVTDGNANSQSGGNNTGVSTQAGDILLQALGLNATITIDSAVRTQGGAIHVTSELNVLQNSDLLVVGSVNNPARNSIVVESLSGSVVMSGTAQSSTQDGNIVYSSANDTSLGRLTAGLGSVAVVAGGSILDGQLDTVSSLNGFATQTGQARVVNIQALNSSLRSGSGICVAGNPLDVEVKQIAVSSQGSAYLYETNGLVVGPVVAIDATRVHLNSTTANLSIARLDGATSTNGHVKIETQLGRLEIASAVAAQQDVLLVSGSDNVVINDTIQSQDGAISVLARQSVQQNANLSITTGNDPIRNSVLVQSLAGSITMQPLATSSTRGGNIAYLAATDVSVGILNAGTGSILIRAGGSILDSQADTVGHDALGFATSLAPRIENLKATSVQLVAGGSVGIGGNPLDTSVDRLAVNAGGSVYLYETNGLTIDTISAIDVTQVHLDSTTALVAGSQLSGVTSTSGNAKLETISGPLTVASVVNAQQDVLLVSGSDNIVINDTVQSQDGAISVLARQTVQQNASLSITTGNDPVRNSVLVQAVSGSIAMQPATTTSTRGGNIAYLAATDVSVGVLSAGTGSILVRAGSSILDSQADSVGHDALGIAASLAPRVENLIAASALLVAGGSVGVGGNPLDTSIDRLAVNASGNVYVYETNGLTVSSVLAIDATRVHLDSTTALVAGSQLSGVTSTSGHAKLETISGPLGVGSAVAAQQDVLLVSGSDNVIINDTVQSKDGAISVLARQTVQQNADLSITTGNDPIRNSVLVQSLAGSIAMQPATTTSTRGGNIAYFAATEVNVGVLSAGTGRILVRAGGSILDAQADTVGHNSFGFATNLVPRLENLNAASAQLVAGGSVGISGNPLDTSLDKIAVDALDHVYLLESTNIEVGATSPISYTDIFLQSTFETVASQQLTGIVSQTGHVKLETLANEIRVTGSIAASRDIELATPNARIAIDATIASQVGAVSIVAGAGILQSSSIQIVSARDPISNSIYAHALNGSIDMSPSAFSRTTAGNIVYQAAQNIVLGQLNTATGSVALLAGGVMTDSQQDLVQLDQSTGFAISNGVARVENVIANSLSVQATRVGTNSNPIDINAQVLAIAVQESASLLETNQVTIGSVPAVQATQNHLDSTQQARSVTAVSGALAANGFFNLQSLDGSIEVDSNANAGVIGGLTRGVIASADVLIAAGGLGDLVIESSVASQQQDVWLAAGRFLVTPLLQVGGTQTAVVDSDHLTAYAGMNIFLPNTSVNSVEFKVAGGINVLAPRQLLNHFADQAGTLILNQIQHGPTNTNPKLTTPSTPISTDSFQAWKDHFRFTERFSEGYTVFLRNEGSLTLQERNFDRSLNVTGQQPGVYLETLKPNGLANAPSDLVVSGKNTIVSTTTNQDPGIVLVADQNLVVQGSIELVTPLAIAAPKNQVLNQLALNASAYHAGLGDPQSIGPAGHSVPVTTEYVVDPIRSQTEDYRTHVNQRVLMEFGNVGESGFLTMVHYADNAFQVFRNQGEVSALAAPSEFALQPARANLMAIGNTTNDAALFTRSTDFTQVDRFFLQNNRDLPTDVVIRRSLDYFLFSNAQSNDPNQIIDHTSFAQEIVGVKSLGTPSLGPITPIPDGIAPPDPPTRGESAQADRPLSLILPQIELKQVKSEAIEVAIFRIGFDDRNSNGQVETTELPAFDDVLNRVDLDSKLPISSKNAGQSPSQGEVDEVKARLLETPDQPSGAYAIIRKNADGKQEVLDVFSVRDWPEESKENGEDRNDSDDESPASPNEEDEEEVEQQSEAVTLMGLENREDASQRSNAESPVAPKAHPSSSSHNDSGGTESSRIKEGAAVLCTLWLLHQRHEDPAVLLRPNIADSSSASSQDTSNELSFNRQDRLRRRAKIAIAKITNQTYTNQ